MKKLKPLNFYNATFKYTDHEGDLVIQLDIDNHDRILDIGGCSEVKNWCEQIVNYKEKLVGKKISELYFDRIDNIDITGLAIMMAIKDFTGELLQTPNVNSKQLICRCKGIDAYTLDNSIEKHQADKSKVMKELHISLICGGCSNSLNERIAKSSWRQNFFCDIPNQRWIQDIENAFERSKVIENHLIPNQLEYKVIRYQNNNVKIRAVGPRNGQNRFELTEILQNFLRQKIHPEIKVSVVL